MTTVTRVRKRRMNPDGSYDILHYETSAEQVLMSDGRTLADFIGQGSFELTDEMRAEIVNAVLDALPAAEGVSY